LFEEKKEQGVAREFKLQTVVQLCFLFVTICFSYYLLVLLIIG